MLTITCVHWKTLIKTDTTSNRYLFECPWDAPGDSSRSGEVRAQRQWERTIPAQCVRHGISVTKHVHGVRNTLGVWWADVFGLRTITTSPIFETLALVAPKASVSANRFAVGYGFRKSGRFISAGKVPHVYVCRTRNGPVVNGFAPRHGDDRRPPTTALQIDETYGLIVGNKTDVCSVLVRPSHDYKLESFPTRSLCKPRTRAIRQNAEITTNIVVMRLCARRENHGRRARLANGPTAINYRRP